MPKGPFKFIYSSSPDRGLVNLLEAWSGIRAIFPDSTLYVCYGVENWLEHSLYSHSLQGDVALRVKKLLKQQGIIYTGKIGQGELAKLQAECTALLYPCDPMSPTETGCITAVEAGASYTPMILGNVDCLPSEYGHCAEFIDMPFDKDKFVEKVRNLMTDEELYIDLMKQGRAMAESRDWDLIAHNWINWFKGELNERRSYAQAT
jgi:glycosyltransferase involved in cell wall biosynthesis